MPGKARFYNNRRPLNPRRPIVAPNAAAPTVGKVNLIYAYVIDTTKIELKFDAPLAEPPSITQAQCFGITQATALAQTWDIFDSTAARPQTVTQTAPDIIQLEYDGGDLPPAGNIDNTTMFLIILGNPDNVPQFPGRLIDQDSAGKLVQLQIV